MACGTHGSVWSAYDGTEPMMRYGTGDWLEVVYGTGLEVIRRWGRRAPAGITVREAPSLATLSPGKEQRIRVTVSPSVPGTAWHLYLVDTAPESSADAEERSEVWWRVYPGTWQPLTVRRQRVAEGYGRVRINLSVRLREDSMRRRPQLRFETESP